MNRLKILHILEGDNEAHYFNNLVDFSDDSVELSFVTFSGEGPFTESMKRRGCRVYALGAESMASLPRAAKGVWQIIKSEDPDLVHTHLFNPTIIALIASKLQGRKVVITRHHSDAVHLIPKALKRRFYLAIERYNDRRADHIIAPSQMVRECLVGLEKTPAAKVSVIPYGQSSERFDAMTHEVIAAKRIELGMDKQLSLVCVSRLYHRKGHIFLFEALAPLIKNGLNAKLYLVGAGDHRETLERAANDLGIREYVEFLGWRDDGLAIIGSADIIVHPSLEDALSQALIESLMLARPIIATDISGAADTLDGGKYGSLVPPADAGSFRTALEITIGDLEGARLRAKKGRDHLLDYMDAARVAAQYRNIYLNVVGKSE